MIRDGIVCKVIGGKFLPYIPRENVRLVQYLLHGLHDSALGGHVGREKLFKLA